MKKFLHLTLLSLAAAMATPGASASEPARIPPGDATTYKNNVVLEISTGAWCSWCVRGIAAVEYYLDHYKDDADAGQIIPIAVHYNDEMALPAYSGALNPYSYPTMKVNRKGADCDPADKARVESQLYVPAYWQAKLFELERVDNTYVNVSFCVRCGYDNDENVKYCVILKEDGVGPYYQNNASYSQKENQSDYDSYLEPYLTPWFTKGNQVSTIYNNVARSIQPNYYGAGLPTTSWEKDKFVKYTFKHYVPNTVKNRDNLTYVVLVLDPKTNQIIASDTMKWGETRQDPTSGIQGVALDDATPYTLDGGTLTFAGTVRNFALYSADGRTIYTGSPRAINLSKGTVYILRADGKTYRLAY